MAQDQLGPLCAGTPWQWWEPGHPGNANATALCRVCPLRVGCMDRDPMPRSIIRGTANGAAARDVHGKAIPICDVCGRTWGKTAKAKQCIPCSRRPAGRPARAAAIRRSERQRARYAEKHAGDRAERAALVGAVVLYLDRSHRERVCVVADYLIDRGELVLAPVDTPGETMRCRRIGRLSVVDPGDYGLAAALVGHAA